MKAKSRYYSCSRITEAKFRQVVRFFTITFNVLDTDKPTNILVLSINTIYIKLRKKLLPNAKRYLLSIVLLNSINRILAPSVSEEWAALLRKDVAHQEKIVFELPKRDWNLYTEIVPDFSKAKLLGIIRRHIELNSVINTDCWRRYDGMVDIGFDKNLRVNYGSN